MENKVVHFVKDVKLEMAKVSWPTKDELVGSTIVVFISLTILTIFIGICDLVLSKVVNIIISRI